MNKVKYLLTYRYSEIIHDLTVTFCKKYINPYSFNDILFPRPCRLDHLICSTGVGQADASKKGEIKLLGVAKASIEELLTDYEDYLRQHNLTIYPKTHPKTSTFRKEAYLLSNLSNLDNLGNLLKKPLLSGKAEDDANFLLTLCHLQSYLLDKQIKSLIKKFTESGGFTENLYQKRKEIRKF